jgi:hypothetical protein
MEWRISRENAELIARSMSFTVELVNSTHMMGMPVTFTDNDEILLVLKV